MGVSKIGVPQNGWFKMKNPIKMDDLGVPLFSETSTWRVGSQKQWELRGSLGVNVGSRWWTVCLTSWSFQPRTPGIYSDFITPAEYLNHNQKKLFMEKHPAPLRMRQKLVWPHSQNGLGHPKWFFPDFCPSTKFTKNAGDQWGSSSLLLPAGEVLGAAVGCRPVSWWFFGGRRATWPERYFLIPYTEDPCEISRVF